MLAASSRSMVLELRLSAIGHKDVRWFDVAMNDAVLVHGSQSVDNLDAELQ